jgi:hypothetical protein
MYSYTIDDSNNAYSVYIDLISSPAGHYLSRRPYLIAMLKGLLATKQLRGKQIIIEEDMGYNIGTTDVVVTKDNDTIYYAQAIKSEVFSRFAKNRYPLTSSMLTVTLRQDDKGNYEVRDIWIGLDHPAFPGDDAETANSKSFWKTHALVHNALPIQTRSVTKEWPY